MKHDMTMTNYENIKSMSIDELAHFIARLQEDSIFMGGDLFSSEMPSDFKAWVKWLNKEVENNESNRID